MFVEVDDPSVRMCSTCNEKKSVEAFYKDGYASDGSPRYRRDCKECYRVTRLSSRRAKRAPVKPSSKRRPRKG